MHEVFDSTAIYKCFTINEQEEEIGNGSLGVTNLVKSIAFLPTGNRCTTGLRT